MIHNNKYDYSKSVYKNNKIRIEVICKSHGSFFVRPDSHIFCKSGCPKCKKKNLSDIFRKSLSDFVSDSIKIHGKKYDYSKVDYITTHTKVEIICHKHGSFYQTPNSHLIQKSGCPICKSSKGESRIKVYLDYNNIKYIRQKTFGDCKNPKTNKVFQYDFYLPDQNILIEYDGRQHYMFGNKFGKFITTEKDLKENQYKDKLKTEYAKEKNIKLLRISYDKKNIEEILNKELIC